MKQGEKLWADAAAYLAEMRPEDPVLFFAPAALQARAREFQQGFPGLLTYAVKSNPAPSVIDNLAAAGVAAFDVASPGEIALIRARVPGAALHYNNPVRSAPEIAAGVAAGVASYSVDSASELAKLMAQVPKGVEIAVRFALPVQGAAYNFGAKFGAGEVEAAALLAQVAAAGYAPSLCFHPGTQCLGPEPWAAYIAAAARIAKAAGVPIARLNVGGGFPSHRAPGPAPDLTAIFAGIAAARAAHFPHNPPQLLCEPGRGLCADAFLHAARVKARRGADQLFLNDGFYGAYAEFALVGPITRHAVLSPEGRLRQGPAQDFTIFGPTCDSVDRMPGSPALPADTAEGDYLLTPSMGAYSFATNTRFNGFGDLQEVLVQSIALPGEGGMVRAKHAPYA